MIEDYDGAAVIDATGEKIGTVEHSYVDDGGQVRIVAVKLGTFFAKHRLVPVSDAGREDGQLRIPYTKAMVERAPDVDAGETLEDEALQCVRAYYMGGETQPPAAGNTSADGARHAAEIRDRGDVLEVPIVEEELVKQPVVKEILRIRKDTVTDRQQIDEMLRKEDVEVDRTANAELRTEPPGRA